MTNPLQNSVSRRGFIALGGGLASAAVLTACSSDDPVDVADSGYGDDVAGEITYWFAFDRTDLREYWQKNVVEEFNTKHPDATLKTDFKPAANLDQLIATGLASGKGPDVVFGQGPGPMGAFVEAGQLASLEEYRKALDWDSRIPKWALDVCSVDGVLYGLPTGYEAMLFFYNQTLFDEKGWSVPTNREEIEAIAEEAMGSGIIPFAAGNAEFKPALEWLVTVFFNSVAGPDAVYAALSGKTEFTDPAFVNTVTLMKEWFDKGWIGGSTDNYFTNQFGPQNAKLASGEAAMAFTGSWSFADLATSFEETGQTYSFASPPAMGEGVPYPLYPLGVGGTWSANADSKNVGGVATFLDFMYSDPKRAGGEAAVGIDVVPVELTDADIPEEVPSPRREFYLDLPKAVDAGGVGYTTWTFFPPKTDTYIYTEMEKVLVGQLTPEEYCEGLATTFKAEFDAGLVPPLIAR